MKLHGRIGELRIYDSSDIAARGAAANMDIQVYDDSEETFTDKGAEGYAADVNYSGDLFVDEGDYVYVGCTTKFARIKVVKGAGGTYAAEGGILVVEYYNGSAWVAVEGLLDDTKVSGDSLAQDGIISFKIKSAWALRGHASLDANKYYIRLSTTDVPSTAPSLDQLAPVDGQYYYIPFVKMDYNSPLGRGRREEILVLNRGTFDSYANYMEGSDDKLFGSVPVGFSADIDDTHNRVNLNKALSCDNPGTTYWGVTGVSSKGSSWADASTKFPVFVDTNKKTVNIQVIWEGPNGSMGWALYEVYFDGSELKLTESDDGLTMALSGLCFGAIEIIEEFGIRY